MHLRAEEPDQTRPVSPRHTSRAEAHRQAAQPQVAESTVEPAAGEFARRARHAAKPQP